MEKDFILRILNERNKPITKEFINSIFKKYGVLHSVINLKQFQRAMIHTSYLNKNILTDKTAKLLKDIQPIDDPTKALPLQESSYETLEFLGDAIIHAILASYLFARYNDKDEGFMTKLRTKIESGGTLCKLSRKIGLHEYAIFARNIELAGGRVNNINIMEDIFEAFVGALSLEADYGICKEFVINVIDKELDLSSLIKTEDNYKEMLMQYYHKIGAKSTPIYGTIAILDAEPRRQYKMYVKDPVGGIVGEGIGISKKIGMQAAAKQALIKFGAIKEINEDEDEDNDYYGELSDGDELPSIIIGKNEIKKLKN
jgi:dsRNA-specific ribonuclease